MSWIGAIFSRLISFGSGQKSARKISIFPQATVKGQQLLVMHAGQEATFHIDPIVPRAAGGVTAFENLALACVSCSLRKGARTTAIDPATGDATQIFHPRLHEWSDHFGAAASGEILGLTATGRGTVAAMSMNRELSVMIRYEERSRGRWP